MSADEKEIEEQASSSEIPEPPATGEQPRVTNSVPIVTTEPPSSLAADAPTAVTTPAASSEPKPGQMPPQPKERRSRWDSSFVALRYLSGIGRDTQIKVRDSDRATSFGLLIVSIFTLVSIFVPPLIEYRFNLLAVADLLAGVSIVFYIANRFGIISTLPPRAALLAWQLMLGAWFIGIYVTINVVLLGFLNQHHPPVPDTTPVHVAVPPQSQTPAQPPEPAQTAPSATPHGSPSPLPTFTPHAKK